LVLAVVIIGAASAPASAYHSVRAGTGIRTSGAGFAPRTMSALDRWVGRWDDVVAPPGQYVEEDLPQEPASAKAVFERFTAAFARGDDAAVEALIHPQAQWQTLASSDRPLKGRAEILHAVVSWLTGPYGPTVHRVEELSEEAVLVVGRLRHEIESGFADSPAVWIDEVRDSMIIRVRLFSTEDQARVAFAEQEPWREALGRLDEKPAH
jgi:hypothetical protein